MSEICPQMYLRLGLFLRAPQVFWTRSLPNTTWLKAVTTSDLSEMSFGTKLRRGVRGYYRVKWSKSRVKVELK